MHFLFIFLIAGFLPMALPAQNISVEALKKYSYYVFGNQPTPDGKSLQTVEGTCFFVETNSQIFLVSAKHLMTSWSTADAEKPVLYPDTLFVRFPAKDSSSFHDFSIDIRALKATAQGSFYYNEPDIFVMAFPEAARFNINSIAIAAISDANAAVNTHSVVYGFPKTTPFYLEGRVFSSPAENIAYRDHKRNTAVSDSINYLVKNEGMVQGGYSGAPVFLKNEQSGTWYFGGVVSQGVPVENYFFVVKPSFLLQKMNNPGQVQ